MKAVHSLTGAALLLLLAGCAVRPPQAPQYPVPPRVSRRPESRPLPRMRYSVQVGAFGDPENALQLVEILAGRGLAAFYYAGDDGLHRVRFGDFDSQEVAAQLAEEFRANYLIDDYYVLSPEPPAAARDDSGLRDQLVRTARSFLGKPYRWGGPSPETGFDCSGLTMAVYRLHGLALPRTSAEQFALGDTVRMEDLREADLVFFDTNGRGRPSHVGLYLGDGRFIHAPRSGRVVRCDALAQGYYRERYLAGRSYLAR